MFTPRLLKRLWVGAAFSSGQGRCRRCPVKHRGVLWNEESPENLAAVAGVFGSQSGHPPLCLSGALLFKGWAPLVSPNTPSMRLHGCLKCFDCQSVNFMTMFLEDILQHVLSGSFAWGSNISSNVRPLHLGIATAAAAAGQAGQHHHEQNHHDEG